MQKGYNLRLGDNSHNLNSIPYLVTKMIHYNVFSMRERIKYNESPLGNDTVQISVFHLLLQIKPIR